MAGTIERGDPASASADRARRLTELLRPGWLFGFVVAALGFLRVAVGGGLGKMWGEDGAVFYANAENLGPLDALRSTYEGYLHTAPTLVAIAVSWVPEQHAATIYLACWCTIAGLLAWYVAAATSNVFRTHWAPLVFGSGLVLLPVMGAESIGSIANLQWVLLVAAAVAVSLDSSSSGRLAAERTLVTVTALTTPLAIALMPAAILRRRDRPMVVCLGLGLAVQAVAVLGANGERTQTGGGASNLRKLNAVLDTFVGMATNGVTSIQPPPSVLTPLGAVVFALAAWGLVKTNLPRFAAWFILVAAGQWWLTFAFNNAMPRYAVLPAMSALLAALLAIESLDRRSMIGAIACLGLIWAGAFRLSDGRASGPIWADSIKAAACVDGHRTFGVSPVGWDHEVKLDC